MADRKPFRYITNKYNITRAALYKRIRKIPNFKNEHMIKQNNMWLIDEVGIKQITTPKRNSTAKVKNTRKGVTNSVPTKNDYIRMCRSLIQSNNKLTDTNNQLQKVISKLTDELNNNKQLKNTSQELLNYTKQEPRVKHSFFWHLVHKW